MSKKILVLKLTDSRVTEFLIELKFSMKTNIGGDGTVLDGLLCKKCSWRNAIVTIKDYQIMDEIR